MCDICCKQTHCVDLLEEEGRPTQQTAGEQEDDSDEGVEWEDVEPLAKPGASAVCEDAAATYEETEQLGLGAYTEANLPKELLPDSGPR